MNKHIDIKTYLTDELKYIQTAEASEIDLSITDCHAKGLHSIVYGNEPGTLKRAFIATRQINPFDIALHNHRYDLMLTVLTGSVLHHTADKSNRRGMDCYNTNEYKYSSVIMGNQQHEFVQEVGIQVDAHWIPRLSPVFIGNQSFHSISCVAGSIWIINELGYKKDHSSYLGSRFKTDGLYNDISTAELRTSLDALEFEIKKAIKLL